MTALILVTVKKLNFIMAGSYVAFKQYNLKVSGKKNHVDEFKRYSSFISST